MEMESMTVMQGMMHGPHGGWGGPPGPFLFVPFLFLFWAGLLALAAWAAFRLIPRLRDGGGWPGSGGSSAERILRERFARGETSAEEYGRALKVLREDGPTDYEGYVREAEESQDPDRGAGL
jgi:putative membrane protein